MTLSEQNLPPTHATRWRYLAVAVGLGVALDQLTKLLAHTWLRGREPLNLLDGWIDLRYARNPGAFFSMGARLPPLTRRLIFIAFGAVAAFLLVRLYRTVDAGRRTLRAGLTLLLAGAAGNLVDRVLRGEVIDFVHVYRRGLFDWATFNVADTLIVAGLCCLALDLWTTGRDPAASAASEPVPRPTEADA